MNTTIFLSTISEKSLRVLSGFQMGENILKHKATGQVVVLFLSGNLMIAEARGLEITSLTKKICRNYHFNKFSALKYFL